MFPEHFPLAELIASARAQLLGIDNTPPVPQILRNLERGAWDVLMPIRELLDSPMRITSGYRSAAVNQYDAGVPHSQHCAGLAADFFPSAWTLTTAFDAIRASAVPFDQLILESACLHVSWPPPGLEPRREALIRSGSPGHFSYRPAP